MVCRLLPVFFVLLTFVHAQSSKETDWQPDLASGGAPECSKNPGTRTSYSATAHMRAVTASIVGNAIRSAGGRCERRAELKLSGSTERTVPLPIAHHEEFEIADFSPDGRTFLLVAEKDLEPPYDETRNVEVAVVDVNHPEIRLTNVWEVFGGGKCEATVEPQGFTQDGRVLLLARPSVRHSETRNDCVPDWGLYATDMKSAPKRLPFETKVPRFGTVTAEERQACKSDPDIIEACYAVHGRLNVWNGTPSLRIWRTGTTRILGVREEYPLPAGFDNYDLLNGAAWGDFEVCPFTKDKPGEMRMVCVESASHLTYKKY